MKQTTKVLASAIVAATVITGCASPQPQPVVSQPYPSTSPAYATSYGVVDSIQMVNSPSSNSGVGVGTVAGGVVGGLLGNQVGSGSGRAAATAAGVVGGAIVGNKIQNRNNTQSTLYQIGIRLDNGSYQTVTQDSAADLAVGYRVRIDNGRVYRY